MIRNAELHDAESIAKVIVEAWQSAYTGIIDQSFPHSMKVDKFVSIMTNNISENLETIFVYEDDEKIKGFISGKKSDGKYNCETVGLYISPKYQRQGIGKSLLDEMKKYFKNNSCKTMIIWTLLNAENNSFYKKQGGNILEEKEIELGDKKYPGAGFVFQL